MKLSEKIKTYRKTFDLSQEQLAEKLNVSRQVITKWETEGGLPEISNLKALAELFNVSVDYLLDDNKIIEYPILKEKYTIEGKKNNFNNRYDYVVSLLKEKYKDNAIIYGLTEIEHGERNIITKTASFFTLKLSDISYFTQWLGELAIWFLVEKNNQKLLIKVTKDFIETSDISNIIDTNNFTYNKNKFKRLNQI